MRDLFAIDRNRQLRTGTVSLPACIIKLQLISAFGECHFLLDGIVLVTIEFKDNFITPSSVVSGTDSLFNLVDLPAWQFAQKSIA